MPYQEISPEVKQQAHVAVAALDLDPIPLVTKGLGEGAVQIVPLSVDDFLDKAAHKFDALVFADSHYRQNFEALGKAVPIFLRAGFQAGFIEAGGEKQKLIDYKIKHAEPSKTGDQTSFKVTVADSVFEPLYYPIQQTQDKITGKLRFPLICCDKQNKKLPDGNLGVGNAEEQLAAKKAYAEKYGWEAAEEKERQFRQSRMDDNAVICDNLKQEVQTRGIKKFIFPIGEAHTKGVNAINRFIASDLGMKTAVISIQAAGNRIISPIIIKGDHSLNYRPGEPPDYRIYLPDDDIKLNPKQLAQIHAAHDFMYKSATADTFREAEFAKWQHAQIIMHIDNTLQQCRDLLSGKDQALCDFEHHYGVSENGRALLTQTVQRLETVQRFWQVPPPILKK